LLSYTSFKVIHMLGIVIFLGNIIVTGVWKAFADSTQNAEVIAFAQRLVTLTDWAFTLGGVILILAGGYGMASAAGYDLRSTSWLVWAQGAFLASGVIWVAIPHSRSDPAGAARARLRERRRDPADLLAAEPAVVFLGRPRHHHSADQPLCDGRQTLTRKLSPAAARACHPCP
jgi:uncharacterized membrane protein